MQIKEKNGLFIARLEFTHMLCWKDELVEALTELRRRVNIENPRVTLHYRAPVQLPGFRKASKRKQITGFLIDHPTYGLCFSAKGRTGYNVRDMEPIQLEALSVAVPLGKEEQERNDALERERFMEQVRRRRYDATVWTELRADSFVNGCRFYDIRKAFDSMTLSQIRRAFEGKSAYQTTRCAQNNRGRTFKIEMRLGADGQYCAWFFSYYPGCANGDIYALISPETAAYLATD